MNHSIPAQRAFARAALTAIATLALVAIATPDAYGQACRRSCKTGETRDVRGCCISAERPSEPAERADEPSRDDDRTQPDRSSRDSDERRRPRSRREREPVVELPAGEAAEVPAAAEPESEPEPEPKIEIATDAPSLTPALTDAPPPPPSESRMLPTWAPWTVAGVGVATVGLSAVLFSSSRSAYRDYDREYDARCDEGCFDNEYPELTQKLDSARSSERNAYIALGVGAAAIAAGTTLIWLNRPARSERDPAAAATLTPTISADTVGVSASLRF